MEIFIIKTYYEFELKLKELYEKGYYFGQKETEPFIPTDIINSKDLESLVLYVGMYKDEPMKLEWGATFINPTETDLKDYF